MNSCRFPLLAIARHHAHSKEVSEPRLAVRISKSVYVDAATLSLSFSGPANDSRFCRVFFRLDLTCHFLGICVRDLVTLGEQVWLSLTVALRSSVSPTVSERAASLPVS